MPRLRYQAILKVNGENFVSKGKTVFEAIQKLHPQPAEGPLFFKTKGYLAVSNGKKVVERNMLTQMQLRRLFNKFGVLTTMKIIALQIDAGFK